MPAPRFYITPMGIVCATLARVIQSECIETVVEDETYTSTDTVSGNVILTRTSNSYNLTDFGREYIVKSIYQYDDLTAKQKAEVNTLLDALMPKKSDKEEQTPAELMHLD